MLTSLFQVVALEAVTVDRETWLSSPVKIR